ncbi:hypothetical protein BJX99DRAFT_169767 [Aspergillus californicus]
MRWWLQVELVVDGGWCLSRIPVLVWGQMQCDLENSRGTAKSIKINNKKCVVSPSLLLFLKFGRTPACIKPCDLSWILPGGVSSPPASHPHAFTDSSINTLWCCRRRFLSIYLLRVLITICCLLRGSTGPFKRFRKDHTTLPLNVTRASR